MNETVEMVSRAIGEKIAVPLDRDCQHVPLEEIARAALLAMRDLPWPDETVGAVMQGNVNPVMVYRGLIDAALSQA